MDVRSCSTHLME